MRGTYPFGSVEFNATLIWIHETLPLRLSRSRAEQRFDQLVGGLFVRTLLNVSNDVR